MSKYYFDVRKDNKKYKVVITNIYFYLFFVIIVCYF